MDQQSLDKFICFFAKKIAFCYSSNRANEEDYVQEGYLKLLEVGNECNKAYAIVAIARAMRRAALANMYSVSAPYVIKRRIHEIQVLMSGGKTDKEVCGELDITMKALLNFKSLITTEVWHRLFEEPVCSSEPFSIIDDITSSLNFTENEKIFLQSQFSNDMSSLGLTRKQRWSKTKSLRSRLVRCGYGMEK